jgi:hypothetical protein
MAQLIKDALRCEGERATALAELIHEKTRPRWIGPPLGLFLSGGLDPLSKPILRVLGLYDPYVAKFTGLDHEHFVQLVNHRGLADAGIAGDQDQFPDGAAHNAIEGGEQGLDLLICTSPT